MDNKNIEKVRSIVKDCKTAMMATISEEGEMRARPMATSEYDEEGNIWFFTDKTSEKVDELSNQQPILLTYSNTTDNKYLSLTGTVSVVDHLDKKQELFSIFTKAWFPSGAESENLVLLKFTPSQGEYWDPSDSSLVQLFKIGKAILTGTEYESDADNHAKVAL